MKRIYGIELTEEQATFLKVRFSCQTDGDLRNILQRIIVNLVDKQNPSGLEEEVK